MVDQEKIIVVMAEMIASVNQWIKQVMVVEKGVKRCGEEKPLELVVENRQEQNNNMLNCVSTEEVIGKPTMIVGSNHLTIKVAERSCLFLE